MKEFFGILVMLIIVVGCVCLYIKKVIPLGGLIGISLIGIVLGIVIANINVIKIIKYKGFEMATIRDEIVKKAEEIKKEKEIIDRLAQQVEKSKQTVVKTRKEVEATKIKLRESTKKFIEAYYYSISTRNIFPIPQPVAVEIEKNLNYLAEFAYPNSNERAQWIAKINKLIKDNLPK
ncbi:hypothetical protein KAW55_01920 [bacterium]|nr:hypothetical protein [bacterium]